MAVRYDILIKGYAHPGEMSKYIASPTTLYLEDGDVKIIVDPGANAQLLKDEIGKRNLVVNCVFLTHYHPDHFLNIRLFPDLDIIDGSTIWSGDVEIPYTGNIPGTSIEVLPTPGHTNENVSLKFRDESGKVIVFCPDVFWWEDGAQSVSDFDSLVSYIDPFATNVDTLIESRKKVLKVADYIIPGHGEMFFNPFRQD